jgi:signal transduction histidine kinase
VAHSQADNILADFAHQLRQPLSILDALAYYLDLIATPEDAQVHEHLRRMRSEIAHADQVLSDGLGTLRASMLADVPPATVP